MSIDVIEYNNSTCIIICGDSREELKTCHTKSKVDLIITSPPYADARDNQYDSIHPDNYADWFLTFHDVLFNILKPRGSLVINIKDKVVKGVKHRYVWETINALCELGWYSIDDYIWHKTNPMPGYWPNRLRDGWEYCFHLSKTKRPYFNSDAVKKPIGDWADSRLKRLSNKDFNRHNSVNESGFGRDISKWVGKRTVLPSNVISQPVVGKNKGHPAVFPISLPLFFIKLLCPNGGLVLDPFAGSGTTGVASLSLGRNCILIDNNYEYFKTSIDRLKKEITNELL